VGISDQTYDEMSIFNGISWSTPSTPTGWSSFVGDEGIYLSCVSSTFCMAVGNTQVNSGGTWTYGNLASIYDGHGWSTPVAFNPNQQNFAVNGLSCPTSTFCMATTRSEAITYDGSSWSTPTLIDSATEVSGVSCASASMCVAVDWNGDSIIDRSGAWSTLSVESTGLSLISVACGSASMCVAVDEGTNAYSFNGTSWAAYLGLDPGVGRLGLVSCPTSSFCMAIDGAYSQFPANVFVYDGASWHLLNTLDAEELSSLSCVSATMCAAVDPFGDLFIYSGAHSWEEWSYSGFAIAGVSCASSSFCVAVGQSGCEDVSLTYNGTTWGNPQDFKSSCEPTMSVSCPTSTFCMESDATGSVQTFNGSTWGAPYVIESGGYLPSISCASETYCVAVGNDIANEYALVYNGTTWTSAMAFTTQETDYVAVSCPIANFCQIFNDRGNAFAVDHETIGPATSLDSTHLLNTASVSCASATFCAAVGGGPNVFFYQVKPSTATAPTSTSPKSAIVRADPPAQQDSRPVLPT
jgi:hypothetical protein